jgi:hypothetical protein
MQGDDMKGTAIQVTESATAVISGSTFLNNMGVDLAQGTIALAGTNASRLNVSDSLFDGNFAFLGGCLFIVRAPPFALRHAVTFACCRLRARVLLRPDRRASRTAHPRHRRWRRSRCS